MQSNLLRIAIDGPVGAGKSTVAKAVADRLGIVYVDTGAMYRAVALHAKHRLVKWEDRQKVVDLLDGVRVELDTPNGKKRDGRNVTVILNGEDVSWDIRKGDVGEGASIVSTYPEVRDKLVSMQKEMAKKRSVIMEGRDIGTRVLPDADIKIYMDADIGERAKRKQSQFEGMGEKVSYREAKEEIESRDNREMTRKVDPLRPAEDAWVIDTTNLSVEEVVDKIADRVAVLNSNFVAL